MRSERPRHPSKCADGQSSQSCIDAASADLPITSRADDAPTVAAPTPIVLRDLAPAKVSEVYDTYWRFAAERQNVFFRRARGEAQPWTGNAVLTTYKFTNAYRASDRASQYLIRRVIYRSDLPKLTARSLLPHLAVQTV